MDTARLEHVSFLREDETGEARSIPLDQVSYAVRVRALAALECYRSANGRPPLLIVLEQSGGISALP